MSKSENILTNALVYYDNNTEKYSKFYDKAKYYRIITAASDGDYNILVFYDKNKTEFFRSQYETLGGYLGELKLWVWGWSLEDRKKQYLTAKKLLNYGLDLDNDNWFLKKELITPRFRIPSVFQLDLHVSIASYISKRQFILKLVIPQTTETETTSADGFKIVELTEYASNESDVRFLYLLDDFNK